MRTIVANQLKLVNASIPMRRTDKLLRATLEMLIVDIASKLDSLPPEKFSGMVLEWRLIGFDESEMKGIVNHGENIETN
jgi:hypothetical protein